MTDEFSFEITKHVGVLSEKKNWTMELNLVSWGGRESKYDIRSWSPDHQKMGKGVTMSKEELVELKKLLATYDIE